MKYTFTKDYQPPEEIVRAEILAAGLDAPDVLEVSGSVVEVTYSAPLEAAETEILRDILARLGYFLNK